MTRAVRNARDGPNSPIQGKQGSRPEERITGLLSGVDAQYLDGKENGVVKMTAMRQMRRNMVWGDR